MPAQRNVVEQQYQVLLYIGEPLAVRQREKEETKGPSIYIGIPKGVELFPTAAAMHPLYFHQQRRFVRYRAASQLP